MKTVLLILVIFVAGCADKTFVNVGNNTMVPTSRVAERARQRGITFDEAKQEIRAEFRPSAAEQKVMAEARQRGITYAEADRILEEQVAQQSRPAAK